MVQENQPSQQTPAQNFKHLYLNQKFSDVKLKIGRVFLKAHKSVLSARSEVFKAMFEHDTKESRDNQVVITSFDLPTMKELLRYIYCGRVLNIKKYALDLLPAADYVSENCANKNRY
jgi:speckle-type POZ protein